MFAGKLQRLLEANNADLLPVGSDEADFGYPDPLVDAEFVADYVLQ